MSKTRRNITSEDLKEEVLAKITQYAEKDFPEAPRIHELIMKANPDLQPRLWYGMPGYAKSKDSAVLCFFRKDAFITFGITESVDIKSLAKEESSNIVSSSWYVTELTPDVERNISEVVSKVTQAA